VSLPTRGLPSFDRPVGVTVLLEVLGIALLVWFWKRFSLADPLNRKRLLETGTLPGERDQRGATC
jgi:hypothetical protein